MDMRPNKKPLAFYLYRDRWLYVLLLPVVAYYVIFKYLPMYGTVMAFQEYNLFRGILGSTWVGFRKFGEIFALEQFWKSARNTIILNLATLAFNFPLTIMLALMINEIIGAKFKKAVQAMLYLPHFISWVVVAGIVTNLFTQNGGTVNNILARFGMDSVPFLSSNGWWIFTYVMSNIWKELGWGTIIYLAALTGVDESLYEAAYIDGASKLQRIVFITIPAIKSVVVVMLLLQISKMMTIGLDAPLLLGNSKVMEVSEVLSTYIYRLGIERARYSEATAIGLFQSFVNIVILFLADRFAKAIEEDGIV